MLLQFLKMKVHMDTGPLAIFSMCCFRIVRSWSDNLTIPCRIDWSNTLILASSPIICRLTFSISCKACLIIFPYLKFLLIGVLHFGHSFNFILVIFCKRPRCDEPCKKHLKCGHRCIGLCGEPCPNVCRVCNKEIVQEILFGTEDESDARFVQMQDCKHFFEVSGIDKWMDEHIESDESTWNTNISTKFLTRTVNTTILATSCTRRTIWTFVLAEMFTNQWT
jgi:hypothetical protein